MLYYQRKSGHNCVKVLYVVLNRVLCACSMEMLSDDAIAGLMLEEVATTAIEGRALTAPPPITTDASPTAHCPHTTVGLASSSAATVSSTRSVTESLPPNNLPNTNPFASTNPFYNEVSYGPNITNEKLLFEIDQVILSTEPEGDEMSNDNCEEVSVVSERCSSDGKEHVKPKETITSDSTLNSDSMSTKTCKISSSSKEIASTSDVTVVNNIIETSDSSNISHLSLSGIATSSSRNSFGSSTHTSPARSPVNRPCSLPLSRSNNAIVQPSSATSFVPERSTSRDTRCYAQTVSVTDDDSSNSCSSCSANIDVNSSRSNSSNSDEGRNSRSTSEGLSRSGGTLSPEIKTPAYAPLQDALESPMSYPPPNYPPPPPPRHVVVDSSSNSSSSTE